MAEAAERLQHLRLLRAELQRDRRRGPGRPPQRPGDAAKFGRDRGAELERLQEPPEEEVPGFDPRRLLKLTVSSDVDFGKIPGISVVSQEGADVVILFATKEGMAEFRSRLQAVAAGRRATREELLWAIQAFGELTPEDRTGAALSVEGAPAQGSIRLDVELWPLELLPERRAMIENFRLECGRMGARILDQVDKQSIVLLRIETDPNGLNRLLRMRDVRQVDLPPRYQLAFELLGTDVSNLGRIDPPPDDAPGVVVLDSGVATNHPILAPAVGDAQGFEGESDTGADSSGHGTHVAALVLYGDVEARMEAGLFEPEVRLFSGRIADSSGEEPSEFIENRIERAVRYFKEQYNCKIFNLSFGDSRRIYRGGHVDRLAAAIDTMAREYGVLFVVAAGNFGGTEETPVDWRAEFPDYLLRPEARLLDPAPALNALTVGSIARHEGARMAVRFPNDPACQPVARRDQPSPFTRSGPGPVGAIKPELVEYGGNSYVDLRQGLGRLAQGRELGVLSANVNFATRSPFGCDNGTSYAAPKVAHLAALALKQMPEASPNLLRALLVAHAEAPEAARVCLGNDRRKERMLLGYGLPKAEGVRYSSERRVTLFAEEAIEANRHHFYEVPIPDDFSGEPITRTRTISVAISHMPMVKRTRLAYKECSLSFRVVRAQSLEAVVQAYRRLRKGEVEPSIPEQGFEPTPRPRKGGTVQGARKFHRRVNAKFLEKSYFVVVTSNVPNWAEGVEPVDAEPYALVVVIEDRSENEVQLYSQIRFQLQVRARARV